MTARFDRLTETNVGCSGARGGLEGGVSSLTPLTGRWPDIGWVSHLPLAWDCCRLCFLHPTLAGLVHVDAVFSMLARVRCFPRDRAAWCFLNTTIRIRTTIGTEPHPRPMRIIVTRRSGRTSSRSDRKSTRLNSSH